MVDVTVIGAGINGSWTALHLAKQGYKTILVEQFPLPHTRGSSHGQSRGIRKAYAEPFLTAMMQDAYNQWHQLESQSGVKLLKETGLIVLGQRQDPYFDDVIQSFQKNPDASFKLYKPSEMLKTYPNLSFGPDIWGCFDPVAGVLMADKALKTVWNQFQKCGGTLFDNCPVKEVLPFGRNQVKIQLDNGQTITSKSVVICAGPWTNRITEPLGNPISIGKTPIFLTFLLL